MAIVTRLERKSRRWELVWQSDAEPLANIVAGRLEAEGIRTRVSGAMTPYRVTFGQLGGSWAIYVPAGRAEHAREVLRDNDEAHNVVEHEESGGLTSSQKATVQFAVLALAGLGVAIAALSLLGSN